MSDSDRSVSYLIIKLQPKPKHLRLVPQMYSSTELTLPECSFQVSLAVPILFATLEFPSMSRWLCYPGTTSLNFR